MAQIQQLIEAFMDLDAAFTSLHQTMVEPPVTFSPEVVTIEEFPVSADGITYL